MLDDGNEIRCLSKYSGLLFGVVCFTKTHINKVKLSLFLINEALCHESMWGGSGYVNSLVVDERSASRPGRFIAGETAPGYPLERRLGGTQDRSGHCREEKILDPTGTRTPNPRPFSL
jgi:hypothetical protein